MCKFPTYPHIPYGAPVFLRLDPDPWNDDAKDRYRGVRIPTDLPNYTYCVRRSLTDEINSSRCWYVSEPRHIELYV